MSAFSDYLEGKIVDATLRGVAFPSIATVYVGLSSAAITEAGTTNEVSGTSYARVAITATTANFTSHGATGPASNAGAITFPQAGGSWGTASHVFIADDASAGNVLYHGALTTPKAVGTNDTFQIATGDLDITLA